MFLTLDGAKTHQIIDLPTIRDIRNQKSTVELGDRSQILFGRNAHAGKRHRRGVLLDRDVRGLDGGEHLLLELRLLDARGAGGRRVGEVGVRCGTDEVGVELAARQQALDEGVVGRIAVAVLACNAGEQRRDGILAAADLEQRDGGAQLDLLADLDLALVLADGELDHDLAFLPREELGVPRAALREDDEVPQEILEGGDGAVLGEREGDVLEVIGISRAFVAELVDDFSASEVGRDSALIFAHRNKSTTTNIV